MRVVERASHVARRHKERASMDQILKRRRSCCLWPRRARARSSSVRTSASTDIGLMEAEDISAGNWLALGEFSGDWRGFEGQTSGLLWTAWSRMAATLVGCFGCVGAVLEGVIGWIYPASPTDKGRTLFPNQGGLCALSPRG